MEKKLSTSIDTLCKNLPTEFSTYLVYCRNLRFDEEPDYDYLKKLLRDLANKCQYAYDY